MAASGVLDSFGDPGNIRVSDFVILVEVPHYVFGGGPFSFTFWVVAFVAVHQASFIHSVGSSDAACDYRFEGPGPNRVSTLLIFGIIFIKVGPGGLDVNIWDNAYHVFSVALDLGILVSCFV